MNKRQRNKRIKERYESGIKHLVWYCQLPREVVEVEVGVILRHEATNLNDSFNIYVLLDYASINLMRKYGTGWLGSKRKEEN